MARYVDGFVLPIPKKKVDDYLKIAKAAGKVWMEYGALQYVECMADDVAPGKKTSFPLSVKLKKDEVVFFSFIVYKSRKHRDAVNKKVLKDPRIASQPNSCPFDASRMIFGGFKTVVELD